MTQLTEFLAKPNSPQTSHSFSKSSFASALAGWSPFHRSEPPQTKLKPSSHRHEPNFDPASSSPSPSAFRVFTSSDQQILNEAFQKGKDQGLYNALSKMHAVGQHRNHRHHRLRR